MFADAPRISLEKLISDLHAQAEDSNLSPAARQAAEEITALTVEMDSANPRREPWEPVRMWRPPTRTVVESDLVHGRSWASDRHSSRI
jgi:hypothetical protein